MVHNGIEYGDMQLIAESYHVLKTLGGLASADLASTFQKWNEGVLQSFLIEITAEIFKKKDPNGKGSLVENILDKAGQKGTGKWTVQEALELGVPIPTMAAAVDARSLSSRKEERVEAAKLFKIPSASAVEKGDSLVQATHDALYCSKIMSYAQGMAMLSAASKAYTWNLKLNEIASLWKGGCIIRARFLDSIRKAYETNTELKNLILDPFMRAEVSRSVPGLRKIVSLAAASGIPVPAFSASLAYFDSYVTANLPQNLTQAQRDFFGAHTYERIDNPGSLVHTEW